jgi:hypothetical protein
MKKSIYNKLVALYHKINSIRKSPKQTTPEFVIDLWVKQWISRKLTGAGIKYPKEFLAESKRLSFIPNISGNDIFLDFGKETQVECHFLLSILVRSSSRDKRVPGGDPYVLSLLSNSSMWL